MRVRVTYSVELKDIPLKISSLLADARSSLEYADQATEHSSADLLERGQGTIEIIRDIKEAKNSASRAIEQLDDAEQILVGYHKLLLSQEEEQEGQDITDLESEKIQNFIDDLNKIQDHTKRESKNND